MEKKDYLNKLDAACGDGDFGVGMYRGFKNVSKVIEQQRTEDIGALLDAAGCAILSSIGGASGPLFGTFFIEAGKIAKGKKEIDLNELVTMFEISLEKMRRLGGAKLGDKTIIDALEPGVKCLRESVQRKLDFLQALEMATCATKRGSDSTKDLLAKKGKAKYLGQQSLGYIDPGAKVMSIIFKTLFNTYQTRTRKIRCGRNTYKTIMQPNNF